MILPLWPCPEVNGNLILLLWALASPDRTRRWATLGVVLGVGLLNRLSVLWLGGGMALGLLAGRPRVCARPGPWIAAAIAAAIALPYAAWEATHAWPTIEFVVNVLRTKLAPVSFTGFVAHQALLVHPLVFPLALAGVPRYGPRGARRRARPRNRARGRRRPRS